MTRRVKVAAGAAVVAGIVAYLWWRRRHGALDGYVVASSYVRKNGTCYRVDFHADGTSTSEAVDSSYCDADQTGDGDLANPAGTIAPLVSFVQQFNPFA